jgi:hypothetical protein
VKLGFAVLAISLVAAPAVAQSVTYVEPSDETYVQLIVAATGWAKSGVAKSLGVLTPADAPALLQHAIEAAAKRHGLKRIALDDYTTVCITHPATRSAPISRTCSMKGADAVLQFAEVRVAGDSGSVVTSVTRVPKGESKPETARYCIALVKKTSDWEAYRGEAVAENDQCPKK